MNIKVKILRGAPTPVVELLLNHTILDVLRVNSGRPGEATLRFLQISALIGIGRRSVAWRRDWAYIAF